MDNYFTSFRLLIEINFLDTVAYKIPTGKLETKLYTKDTNRQSHLHRK